MSERTVQLLQEVLALPPDDRAEFSRLLWEHEDAALPEWPHEIDEEAEHAELLRRLASIEDGTAKPRPWAEARAEIRQKLARKRAERDQQS
jgi:putative addiction module component (TIGR02574 family)